MEKIRSFIAVELPRELRLALGELQDRLKSREPSPVKWVVPDGIHLTLKFLGGVEPDRLGAITGAMQSAAQGIPPFHLEVKDLGAFPNLKRVQVVWVGVTGELDKLSELHERLESKLKPLGFTPEARPFSAHLTLARLRRQVSPGEQERLGQLIASTGFAAACRFEVEAVSLMKSELTREGAIYHRLSSAVLEKPLSTASG